MISLSSGDILRHHLFRKTALGILADTFMTQGKLVPDQVMNQLMLEEIEKMKGQVNNFIRFSFQSLFNPFFFMTPELGDVVRDIGMA